MIYLIGLAIVSGVIAAWVTKRAFEDRPWTPIQIDGPYHSGWIVIPAGVDPSEYRGEPSVEPYVEEKPGELTALLIEAFRDVKF